MVISVVPTASTNSISVDKFLENYVSDNPQLQWISTTQVVEKFDRIQLIATSVEHTEIIDLYAVLDKKFNLI